MGFEVYRTKVSNPEFRKLSQPISIEFIGVSGVGKSTAFQNFMKQQKIYPSLNEFKKLIHRPNTQTILDNKEIYQLLAKKRWENIGNQNISETDKFRIAHWNYLTLLDDALVQKYNQNYGVISDEGILHNFSDEILDLAKENSDLISGFLENRAVVYCYSSAEMILNQIRKRENESGRVVAHHKNLTDEELIELIKNELEQKEQLIDLLKQQEVKVLSIDTSIDLDENIQLITQFIEKLKLS